MQKVFLRADAGYGIGYGHFIRTLALADVLKDSFDCTFFTTHPTDYQLGEMAKVCKHVALDEGMKFEDFLSFLKGDEIVVLDNYFYTTDYQRRIKDRGCKLVCIDDMHDKHYVADAVINHTPGTIASQFSMEDYTRLYLGPEYLLIRRQFREAMRNHSPYKNKDNVFICYGGSDEMNLTRKACEIILANNPRHIDAVVGGAYEFFDDLLEYAKDKDITVYRNIAPEMIVDLLQEAYLAVVPDSMVFFEACCVRRPTISGYDCDNQLFISRYNEQHQLGCEIGDLLEDYEGKFTKAYLGMTDGKAKRYVQNQERIITDSSEKIFNIFETL